MNITTKLLLGLGAIGATLFGVDEYKKRATAANGWPLSAGNAYSIHLAYTGAGVGGNPDQNSVQNTLNANGAPGLDVTNTPTVDPTNKIISFLVVATQTATLTAAQLTGNWSSAYGTVSVQSVQDVGGAPSLPTS